MMYTVERANGEFEGVEAESVGLDKEALFFYNGEKTAANVVATFNNRGGWLSVTRVEEN